jgi:hypothetical protein
VLERAGGVKNEGSWRESQGKKEWKACQIARVRACDAQEAGAVCGGVGRCLGDTLSRPRASLRLGLPLPTTCQRSTSHFLRHNCRHISLLSNKYEVRSPVKGCFVGDIILLLRPLSFQVLFLLRGCLHRDSASMVGLATTTLLDTNGNAHLWPCRSTLLMVFTLRNSSAPLYCGSTSLKQAHVGDKIKGTCKYR